ncbi:MAG: hypothetical protein V8T52_00125 [Ruminococcus sp.]
MLSDAGFDYETVFYHMTREEIQEANVALDLQAEAMREQTARQLAEQWMNHQMGRR